MWAQVVLLFLFWGPFHVEGGEIFDVTTIYNVGEASVTKGLSGRVHSRTNALGLPLYDGSNKYIFSKDSQTYNLTCNPINETCSWDNKGWMRTFIDSKLEIFAGEAYKIQNNTLRLAFTKKWTGGSDEMYLYFTSTSSVITSADIFLFIRFHSSAGKVQIFKGCTRSSRPEEQYYKSGYGYRNRPDESYKPYTMTNRDGTEVTNYCSSFGEFPFTYGNDILTFNFNDNRVKIYKGDKNLKLVYEESLYNIVNYFSMSGEHLTSSRPSVQTLSVLTATTEGSDLVSPVFSPDSRQLCLALVVHCDQHMTGDILQVFAQDLLHTEHLLQSVNDIKANFDVKHVNMTLPNNVTSSIKLIIRKVGTSKVTLSRISSCNPKGEEVELLSFHLGSKTTPKSNLPAYTPYFQYTGAVESKSNLSRYECYNGGIWTSDGCSCLPGFSGENCESGCGRNRFGQDCEGLCSFRTRECEGLVMCTAATQCRCAPGYSGNSCKDKCSPGWYGNECAQRCGHCVAGQCDIYTGECSACQPGYHPPYCMKEYVYYALKPELSAPDYGKITVSFNPKKHSTAYGKPEIYQIQYKTQTEEWRTYTSKIITSREETGEDTKVTETIEGLRAGVLYSVRVLLLDNSFNKYDGELVQESEILSKCDIPEAYDYNVTAVSNLTSFTFTWAYINKSEHWCPLELYEVSWEEGWNWLTDLKYQSNFGYEEYTLTEFLPRLPIKFGVRAKTTGGFAPYSKIVQTSTRHNGTSAVRKLSFLSSGSTSVTISWKPPKDSNGRNLQYSVTYKCVAQIACFPGCVNATEGQLTLTETSVTLSPLLPLTRYLITVTPEDGHKSSIYVGTAKALPTETPRENTERLVRTNTSLTVAWDEVPVCSSFLLGYNYHLVKESDSLKVLASGFTKETSCSFHNLTAKTDYIVQVFILTVAGWNSESFLAIRASTSATMPEAVRDLTVYKRGRSMLGLRWAEPRATYGKLKSFTIKYGLGKDVETHIIEPSPCAVWPNLNCHTIEGVKSNRNYNISVSARNTDVAEDGVETVVTGVTKESSPSAPENLKLINSSSTSAGMQWQYPNLANGIVRSFLVNVEETDQFDQDSCCQIYPLVEIPVIDEKENYETEVSGLHPASTYFVSVSAKTVALGPSQTLVVYTRPPHLPLVLLPQLLASSLNDVSWQPQQQPPQVNNTDVYSSLIKVNLLLAMLNETQPVESADSGILNAQLDSLLHQMIAKPFYFVSEYTEEEVVTVNAIPKESESSWGKPSPLSLGQQYQLVAVQVTEYNGLYNADLRFSSAFMLLF